MTENELLHIVIDLAESYGWRWFHEWDSRHKRRTRPGSRGFPDLVLASPRGHIVFAELKSEDGKMRPDQESWREMIEHAELDYRLWRPSDLDSEIIPLFRIYGGRGGK